MKFWRDVKEELPKNGENVYVVCQSTTYDDVVFASGNVIYWDGFNRHEGDDGKHEFKNVIAWARIPKYNGEKL